MLGVSWGDLTVAGAFIVGGILGAAAVLHLIRSVVTRLDDSGRRHEDRHDGRA